MVASQDLEHQRPVVFFAARSEDEGVRPFVKEIELDIARRRRRQAGEQVVSHS